jgi:hypothetical protein
VKYPFIFPVSNSLLLPLRGPVVDCWLLELAALGGADGALGVAAFLGLDLVGATGGAFGVAGLGGLKCFVELAAGVEVAAHVELVATFAASV